jgi:hypothetical protein
VVAELGEQVRQLPVDVVCHLAAEAGQEGLQWQDGENEPGDVIRAAHRRAGMCLHLDPGRGEGRGDLIRQVRAEPRIGEQVGPDALSVSHGGPFRSATGGRCDPGRRWRAAARRG